MLVVGHYHLLAPSTSMQGGESTREEMCVAFVYYYPLVDLSVCLSSPQAPLSFSAFANEYIE